MGNLWNFIIEFASTMARVGEQLYNFLSLNLSDLLNEYVPSLPSYLIPNILDTSILNLFASATILFIVLYIVKQFIPFG